MSSLVGRGDNIIVVVFVVDPTAGHTILWGWEEAKVIPEPGEAKVIVGEPGEAKVIPFELLTTRMVPGSW
jgi:hypothetical protein